MSWQEKSLNHDYSINLKLRFSQICCWKSQLLQISGRIITSRGVEETDVIKSSLLHSSSLVVLFFRRDEGTGRNYHNYYIIHYYINGLYIHTVEFLSEGLKVMRGQIDGIILLIIYSSLFVVSPDMLQNLFFRDSDRLILLSF